MRVVFSVTEEDEEEEEEEQLSSWAACRETNGFNHKRKPFGWKGGVVRIAGGRGGS